MDAMADNDFLPSIFTSRHHGPEAVPRTMLPDIHRDSSPTTSPLKQYIRPGVINQAGGKGGGDGGGAGGGGVGWWSWMVVLSK